jgi:hypothetical protein
MFAGDPHKMVAQLLANEQLDNSEIEQLENMLAAQKAKNTDTNTKVLKSTKK